MTDLSLDHVGAMVFDLDSGADRWRRLGFTLSPRSRQMGFDRARGETEPWATSNHCAVFRKGYLELIGVTHTGSPNPWLHFLKKFEGVHITALRCCDADAAFADISRRTDGVNPPVDRRRQAPYQDEWREMRFRNIFSQDAVFPEGRFIVIEHQTPELIWQEELLDHANGALSLDTVIFVADPPGPTVQRLAALTGVSPFEQGDGSVLLMLTDGGRIEIVAPERLRERFPHDSLPPMPSVAACSIGVRDIAEAERAVRAGGAAIDHRTEGTFSVAPSEANGARLIFRQAP